MMIAWVQGGEGLERPGVHIHSEERLDIILKSKEEKYKNQIIYMHVL